MAAILREHKIFYGSAPKVACTSIKRTFFYIENGFAFRRFATNGKKWNIHTLYKPQPLSRQLKEEIDGYFRLAFVRDPVQRFLSAYSNRVLHHGNMQSEFKARTQLQAAGLPTKPDIHLFIEKFDTFTAASQAVHHHTRPLVYFLGKDPKYFHKLFKLSEMPEFEKLIYERTGVEVTVPRLQTGGPKISRDELSKHEIRKIERLYSMDYKAFSAYF